MAHPDRVPKRQGIVAAALVVVLLAVLLPLPARAQEAPTSWPLADAANDVRLVYPPTSSSAPLPNALHVPFLDLTSVQFEDPSEPNLLIRIKTTGGFKPDQDSGLDKDSLLFSIQFRVASGELLGVDMWARVLADASLAFLETARFCASPSERVGCFESRLVELRLHVEDGAAVVEVPKSFLTKGRTPLAPRTAWTLPDMLRAGDLVKDIVVRAQHHPLLLSSDLTPRLLDRAPDTGSAVYALKTPSNAHDLDVKPDRSAVVEGETSLVPVTVKNDRPAKRLVSFEATVVSSSPGAHWDVNLTSSALLAGGRAANVTLRVNAGPLDATNRATIRLVASVLNEPGVRHVQDWEFLAVPAWGAQANVFRIHGWRHPQGSGPIAPVYDEGLLTRAKTEPGAEDQEPIEMARYFSPAETRFYLELRANAPDGPREALPNPVTVRDEPAKLHLEILASQKLDGEIQVELYSDKLPFGTLRKSWAFQEGANLIDLEVPLNPMLNRLVPGIDSLRGRFSIIDTTVAAPATWPVKDALPFKVRPQVSTLTLPIDRDLETVPSEDLPRVTLAASEDVADYVNTGERIIFEVDLRNEDTRPVSLELEVGNLSEGWRARVLPSTRANLGVGGEVHLGVEVASPANAREGDFSFAVLRALLSDTREVVASIKFRITNTDFVARENETFAAREEDQAELAPRSSGGSPGPSVPWMLLGLLGVAIYGLSRRRT